MYFKNYVFIAKKVIPAQSLLETSTLFFIFLWSHGLQVSSQWMWMAESSGLTHSLKFSHLGKAHFRLLSITSWLRHKTNTVYKRIRWQFFHLVPGHFWKVFFFSVLNFCVTSWKSFIIPDSDSLLILIVLPSCPGRTVFQAPHRQKDWDAGLKLSSWNS